MARSTMPEKLKKRSGSLVHYSFGAGWGAFYALVRESVPRLSTRPGVLAYSTFVWMVSDNFILPMFKLAAWPQKYPPKNHAYAWLAHVAYGAGVWGAYEIIYGKVRGPARSRSMLSHLNTLSR